MRSLEMFKLELMKDNIDKNCIFVNLLNVI